jgi:hypothetical protein
MGPPALLPIRKEGSCRFLLPLKIYRLGQFKPATCESSGKNTNHYITKATSRVVKKDLLLMLHNCFMSLSPCPSYKATIISPLQ